MVPEAKLEDVPGGKKPAGEGWFVVNTREAAWIHNERFGGGVAFEGAHFDQYGINVQVMWPGQPNGLYHGEAGQEDFLILSGECLLLVEGQERRLRAWDFVHCPPWTEHIFVGAGDGPCVIFMSGARSESNTITYPRNDVALRHGAGVETETQTAREAYASFPKWKDGPPDSWDGLPWSDG
jgi:uncharacterized cupin superfamily protein